MKDRLTTDCADSERLKELQRVGDPPPLRHAVILILKKPSYHNSCPALSLCGGRTDPHLQSEFKAAGRL